MKVLKLNFCYKKKTQSQKTFHVVPDQAPFFSHIYFLFKKYFTTERHAQKSTQRKHRHPKLGAEGIALNEVPFVHDVLQK